MNKILTTTAIGTTVRSWSVLTKATVHLTPKIRAAPSSHFMAYGTAPIFLRSLYAKEDILMEQA
ncbi:hypothetical protein J7E73_26010 [Paenibacillus albidus]|uniref:hypothetical protein n=1 Tax=Paenibacillus albidus TaxID=2041023 RepID=UPI001BE8E5A7|nr:hypothetical protein [Paenibacillus albidus]MBT2292526.1 hypothetical protein [Paenibacillus albidus]